VETYFVVGDNGLSLQEPNTPLRRTMEKKPYETPQLSWLGSVQDLTAIVSPPTNCSALDDSSSGDAICEIPGPS
jgi:hypothetical protein